MAQFKDHGRSKAQVLDGNHGIEIITYSTTTYGRTTDGGPQVVYVPWYYSEAKQGTYYYTRVNGWERVECKSWLEAFDHVARSRRMLTSKHAGSNYIQEAKKAGIELPETQAEDRLNDNIQKLGYALTHMLAQDVLTTSEQEDITYSLLVSNVGWVLKDCPDYQMVKKLFDEYAAGKKYKQVTMWSSAEDDPIEGAYIDELNADPWHHPAYDDTAESQPEWDM